MTLSEAPTSAVLDKPEDVTPDWLTEVLRRKPGLAGARVAAVSVTESQARGISLIAKLSVAYDGEPPAGAPRRLFLKMTDDAWKNEGDWRPGHGEVTFYRDVVPAMADPPVPRSYDAVLDKAAKRFHLLLEDLSDSHGGSAAMPLPPTVAECERIMEAYARLHASMWGDPRLGNGIGQLPDFDRRGKFMVGALASFVDLLGDRLSAERRARCERLVAAIPRLKFRFASTKDFTLNHGDGHVWNLLYPRAEGSRDIRIIDWENWHLGPATFDLAYMIAVHWYPERRRHLEDRLLQRYHRTLLAEGVRDYDMDALRRDYRLGVIASIGWPLGQAWHKMPAVHWWQHLERVMLAVEDLGCEAVLQELPAP